MERKIIWEHWIDPFRENEDEEGTDYEPNKSYQDDEEEELIGKIITKEKSTNKPLSVIMSPILGAVPVMAHSIPSKNFNFWVGHTNFDITPMEKQVIETCPGVETFDLLTRYRFRVGIGKVFDSPSVKVMIQEMLCPKQQELDPQIIEQIESTKKQLSDHKYWLIFVTPNGKMSQLTSDEFNDDFKASYMAYKNTCSKVSGILLTSWDQK